MREERGIQMKRIRGEEGFRGSREGEGGCACLCLSASDQPSSWKHRRRSFKGGCRSRAELLMLESRSHATQPQSVCPQTVTVREAG